MSISQWVNREKCNTLINDDLRSSRFSLYLHLHLQMHMIWLHMNHEVYVGFYKFNLIWIIIFHHMLHYISRFDWGIVFKMHEIPKNAVEAFLQMVFFNIQSFFHDLDDCSANRNIYWKHWHQLTCRWPLEMCIKSQTSSPFVMWNGC